MYPWQKARLAYRFAFALLWKAQKRRLSAHLKLVSDLYEVYVTLVQMEFDRLTADYNPYHDPRTGRFTSAGKAGNLYQKPKGFSQKSNGEKRLTKQNGSGMINYSLEVEQVMEHK